MSQMSEDYEIALNMLAHRNTHLKLRERCRLALRHLRQASRPLPPDFIAKAQRAVYLRRNAVAYEQSHFPGWQENMPAEIREKMLKDYPLSGHGVAEMNTLLYLQRTAAEAEAELALEPVPDPEEARIDQMVQDYLSRKQRT